MPINKSYLETGNGRKNTLSINLHPTHLKQFRNRVSLLRPCPWLSNRRPQTTRYIIVSARKILYLSHATTKLLDCLPLLCSPSQWPSLPSWSIQNPDRAEIRARSSISQCDLQRNRFNIPIPPSIHLIRNRRRRRISYSDVVVGPLSIIILIRQRDKANKEGMIGTETCGLF